MKNVILISLVLSSLILCSSTCDKPFFAEGYYPIWIKNESSSVIRYLFSYNYPDTTIPDRYDRLLGCPANTRVSENSKKKWENVFAQEISGGKLIIFIFDIPVTEQNWQQIRNNYTIARRLELTIDDLKARNWEIVYP